MESESTSVSAPSEASQDSNMDPCPVCLVLPLSEPVNITCGHMFCWSCVFVWFVHLGNTVPQMPPSCPLCKKEISGVHKAFGIPKGPRVDQLHDVSIPPWPEDDSWKSDLATLLQGETPDSNSRPRRRILGNPRFDIYDVNFSSESDGSSDDFSFESDGSSDERPGPPRERGRRSIRGTVRGTDARGIRTRGARGVRARGTRIARARGVRGDRARGVRGARARGVRGDRARVVRGDRARVVRGDRARGVRGDSARGVRGDRARTGTEIEIRGRTTNDTGRIYRHDEVGEIESVSGGSQLSTNAKNDQHDPEPDYRPNSVLSIGNPPIPATPPSIKNSPFSSTENSVDFQQRPKNGRSMFDFTDEEMTPPRSIFDHFGERNISLSPFVSPRNSHCANIPSQHGVVTDSTNSLDPDNSSIQKFSDSTHHEADSFRDLFVSTCAAINRSADTVRGNPKLRSTGRSEEPHKRLFDDGDRADSQGRGQHEAPDVGQEVQHQRHRLELLDETHADNGLAHRAHQLQAHHGLNGADAENCAIRGEEQHRLLRDEGDRADSGDHSQGHGQHGVGQEAQHQRQRPKPLDETLARQAHQLQIHQGLYRADVENCGAPQKPRHQPQLQYLAQRRHQPRHKLRNEEEHSPAAQADGEEAAQQHGGGRLGEVHRRDHIVEQLLVAHQVPLMHGHFKPSFVPPMKKNIVPPPQPVSPRNFNIPFSYGEVQDEPPANISTRDKDQKLSPNNLSPPQHTSRHENSLSEDDGFLDDEDNNETLPESKKRFMAGAFLPGSNVTYLEVLSDVLRTELIAAQVPWNKVNWYGVGREAKSQYPGAYFGTDINTCARNIQRRMNTAKKSYERGQPILPKKFQEEVEREHRIREVWSDIINFLSQSSHVAHRKIKRKNNKGESNRRKIIRRTLPPPSVGQIYQETPVVNGTRRDSHGSTPGGYRETTSRRTMGATGGDSVQNKGRNSCSNSREIYEQNLSDGGGVNSREGGGVNLREGGGVNSSNGGGVNSSNGGGVNSSNGGGVNYRNGGGVNYRNGGGVNSSNGGGVNSRNGGASQRMSPTASVQQEDNSEFADQMRADKRQKKRSTDGAHLRDSSLGTMIKRRTNNNMRLSQEINNLNTSLSDLSRARQSSTTPGLLENFSKRLCDRSEERKREEDAEKREDRRIQLMILASIAGKNQNGDPEVCRQIKIFKETGTNISNSPEYPAILKLNNINQVKEDICAFMLEDVSQVYAIAVHLNNGDKYIVTNVTQIKMSSATVGLKLKNNRKLLILTENF